MAAIREGLVAVREYETGELGRSFDASSWRTPDEVEIVDGAVRWAFTGDGGSIATSSRPDLETFLGLADATEVAIARFASRVGPLLWMPDVRASCRVEGCTSCLAAQYHWPRDGWHPAHGAEPVEAWRMFARDATEVLEVAGLLRLGRPVDYQRWENLRTMSARCVGKPARAISLRGWSESMPEGFQLVPTTTESLGHATAVGVYVSAWLAAAGVQVGVVWTDRVGPKLDLRPSGFLGAVGIHIARAVGGAGGFAFCDGCGEAFTPRRRPKAGQRAFCEACRERGEPQRRADRDRRTRERLGRAGSNRGSNEPRSRAD